MQPGTEVDWGTDGLLVGIEGLYLDACTRALMEKVDREDQRAKPRQGEPRRMFFYELG